MAELLKKILTNIVCDFSSNFKYIALLGMGWTTRGELGRDQMEQQ